MPARRQVLAMLATTTSTIGGCATSGMSDAHQVSAEGSVVRQATKERPPAIEFKFKNNRDENITASAKSSEPFVEFPRLYGSSGAIVLLPVGNNKLSADVASSRTDNCWRFVKSDGSGTHIFYEDTDDKLKLEPGRIFRIKHRIYYEGKRHDCFDNDKYAENHTIDLLDEESNITFIVQVLFSDNQITEVKVERK